MMDCEPCICLPVPEGDCLQTSFLDTTQSLPSNGNPTHARSCENELRTDGFQTCKCTKGTFGCSIHPNTRDEWIASMRDSLARICQSLENNPALAMAQEAVSIGRSSELLAIFDPVSSSLKMSQQSLLTDSNASWPTWPRSGMTVAGRVYALPTVVPRISETDGGYWQTPVADDSVNRKNGKFNSRGDPKLSAQVKLWPTSRANDAEKRGAIANDPRNGLPAAAIHWPTPVQSMHKGSSPRALTRKDGRDRTHDRLDHAVMASNGGQLNPTWVAWLMAWPLEWVSLKRLETVKSHSKPQRHGQSSAAQSVKDESACA